MTYEVGDVVRWAQNPASKPTTITRVVRAMCSVTRRMETRYECANGVTHSAETLMPSKRRPI
jgi:hypothetical protein